MKSTILITDTLFILPENEKKLEAAGYQIERLAKPEATEDELCEAVKGKAGYILGGIEHVTKKVIDAADSLKAIAVCGIGYKYFVPAWEYALSKGIAISNTPSGPTQEVAEWAITSALVMNREFFDLGLVGEKQFAVTKGIENQTIGIVGLGRIGSRIAEMLAPFKPGTISYHSQHRHPDKEVSLGVNYLELSELLSQSDIVFVCVGDDAKSYIGKTEIAAMKKGALLVNITHPGIVDEEELFEALKDGRIRAISDYPLSDDFKSLPKSSWYSMKSSNTLTEAGVKLMSDMATESMINLLKTGRDVYQIAKT